MWTMMQCVAVHKIVPYVRRTVPLASGSFVSSDRGQSWGYGTVLLQSLKFVPLT